MTEKKSFITEKIKNIPYSGIYIIQIKDKNLEEADNILKSKEFFNYI